MGHASPSRPQEACHAFVSSRSEFMNMHPNAGSKLDLWIIPTTSPVTGQDEGYDVQTLGFGKMSTYHANNEYCLLSDFAKGEERDAIIRNQACVFYVDSNVDKVIWTLAKSHVFISGFQVLVKLIERFNAI